MAHTSSNVLIHFIFSTKNRAALIGPEIRGDLFAYLGGIVRNLHGTTLIVNGTTDHVHMLVRVATEHSPAEMARVIKANSSKWIHEKWPIGRILPGRPVMEHSA